MTPIARCMLFSLPALAAVPPAPAAPLPAVRTVEIRDGRMLVNGELFLPIAIYHAAHWHKGLREAGEKGFNLVQTYGNTPAEFRKDIEDAFANGLYAAVALNGLCEKPEAVEAIVRACRDAPGLLVWLLEDEPNSRLPEPKEKPVTERPYRVPPEKLKATCDLIRRLDPNHPVWINLCYGWQKDHEAYQPVADIMSDDIYPVPEAALPAVASYADATFRGCRGKPAWLVLQMAPVRPQIGAKDRAPTMAEVRCMTYLALAHGVSGLGYYSFNERPSYDWRIPETAPAFWAQWADLTAELRTLAPLLLAPAEAGEVKAEVLEGPAGVGPWGFPALHLSLRRTAGGLFLIAVNGLAEPVKARLTLPADPRSAQAAVRLEHRLVLLNGRVLEDTFVPYAVHLYEIPSAGR